MSRYHRQLNAKKHRVLVAEESSLYIEGKKVTETHIGHSQICVPVYGTVQKLPGNDEGFVVYKHDRGLAIDAEGRYLLRSDLAGR